jgi:hypothetical protein
VTRLGLLSAACALLVTSTVLGQSAPACSPDTTARSALKGWVLNLVTAPASDSDRVASRDSVRLSAVPANKVSIISTTSTCNSARNAMAPLLGVPASTISVVVVKSGSRYVVQAPTQTRGEFIPTSTLTLQFAVLRNYTY